MFDRFSLVKFSYNFKINVKNLKSNQSHSLCVNKSSRFVSDQKSRFFNFTEAQEYLIWFIFASKRADLEVFV